MSARMTPMTFPAGRRGVGDDAHQLTLPPP
jgi:hypothetical protein